MVRVPRRTEGGDAPGSQSETSEKYAEYLNEEQRREPGCSAGRMQRHFHDGLPGHGEDRVTFRALRGTLVVVGLLSLTTAAHAQATTGRAATPVSLPATIPLFPLEDVTLFPEVTRGFQIFEPRYRELVADALKGDRIIGMVMIEPGHEAQYEGRPPILQVGCAGTITKVDELPDGRYNIVLEGLVRFRIRGEDQTRSYRQAHVEALSDVIDAAEHEVLHRLRPSVEMLFAFISPGSAPPPAGLADVTLVNAIAQHTTFTATQRQRLLELRPVARAQELVRLLEDAPPPPRAK